MWERELEGLLPRSEFGLSLVQKILSKIILN